MKTALIRRLVLFAALFVARIPCFGGIYESGGGGGISVITDGVTATDCADKSILFSDGGAVGCVSGASFSNISGSVGKFGVNRTLSDPVNDRTLEVGEYPGSVGALGGGIGLVSGFGEFGVDIYIPNNNGNIVLYDTSGSSTEKLRLMATGVSSSAQIQASTLVITGNVSLSSHTIIDAISPAFGAVTAGSTAAVTWTEVTDRLGEFVTSSFTVTRDGYYRVKAKADAAQTAGTGCLLLKVDSVTQTGGTSCSAGATALATIIPVAVERILSLSAGNIVRIDASATSANVTFQNMSLAVTREP